MASVSRWGRVSWGGDTRDRSGNSSVSVPRNVELERSVRRNMRIIRASPLRTLLKLTQRKTYGVSPELSHAFAVGCAKPRQRLKVNHRTRDPPIEICLLYTSDAADE